MKRVSWSSGIAVLTAATLLMSMSCDKSAGWEDFDLKQFRFVNTTSAPVRIKAKLVEPDSVYLDILLLPGDTFRQDAVGWGGLAIPFQQPITAPGYFDVVVFDSESYGCWQYPRGRLDRGYIGGIGPWNGLNYEEFDSTRADEDQAKTWTYLIDSMKLVQGEPCR